MPPGLEGAALRHLFFLACCCLLGCVRAVLAEKAEPDELACLQPVDDPQRDLRPIRAHDAKEDCPAPKLVWKPTHVLKFAKKENTYLLLRNGESEGLAVWHPDAGSCLRTLAKAVVKEPGPKFMYSSSGLPLRDINDAEQDHIIVVLSASETWVWPGIKINHTMIIEGAKLTTVSLKPRAFLVENLFAPEFADALIKQYDGSLTRSPEKHYSKGFENHRTSTTGWMSPTDAPSIVVRERVQRILRLPFIQYAEIPQFLRYQPGQWYRYHHDYFHSYRRLPFTELVEWTRARLLDLTDLNVSYSDHSPVAAAARKCRSWIDPATTRDLYPKVMGSHKPLLSAVLNDAVSPFPSSVLREFCDEIGIMATCATAAHLDLALAKKSPAKATLERLSGMLAGKLASELGIADSEVLRLGAAADVDPRLETRELIRKVQCNRHATLLPYLNHVEQGGETVLPDATEPHAFTRDGKFPVRQGMEECSRGVVVSPVKGGAILFYHRLGDGSLDPLSLHGGCPPEQGSVKYALNCFTWSCDSDAGMRWFT